MPLPGGETDKIGNRYEGRWTVHCIIDVMDEKATSIRLEKPGEDAFEFFVSKNKKLECHQVKRQRSGRGRWTLSALEDKQVQVLSDFWKSLSNPKVICVFVSTQDADELGELAQRARGAASWTEFERDFLNKTLFGHFNTLRKKWENCSEIAAFEALKRVKVVTFGEDVLVETVENRIAALVEGDPKTIRIELAELALEKIHCELTAHDIWHYLLQERGYRRRQWGKDPHVLAAVENANNIYISSLTEQRAIGGNIIPRNEAQAAFEQLITQKKQSILAVGEAGVGKSGVMLQVLEKLHNQGVPVLAFRVDRLEAMPLPDKLGEQLGLPGSPAIVLANIAQSRDCVLVIDQLDAVSFASGRNPQFFDCIFEIIKQAQAHPNIHLLLACRKFDLDNDNRLKRLIDEKNGVAKAIAINRLPHSTVRDVVTKLGLETTRLTEKQLNLLSIPLHLSLLAEIAEDSTVDAVLFQTAKELYDQFWSKKQGKLRERLGCSVQWTQVIDRLCDYMSSQQQQSLSAPESVVDEFADDARAMASEHILTWENKRISFFHESFFDYAFARRFAYRGQELLTFLRCSEQHLFRRAQVRQILIHQREENFDGYLQNLRELLNSSDIRFHLKKVVIALLETLDNPTEEKWEIIKELMCSQNPLSKEVWVILNTSIHWFQLLDSLGIIEQWLQDENESHIDKTVTLLSFMQKQLPDRVAELLEPFVGNSERWLQRFVKLTSFAEFGTGRRFFDLFLRLVDIGILDSQTDDGNIQRDFWSLIYNLPKQNSEWSCEAIGHFLNRRLNISLKSKNPNPFEEKYGVFPYSAYYKEAISESASNAPQAFIENVLPFMLQVMDLTAFRQVNPPWQDAVWWFRIYGDDYGIDKLLLKNMEAALSNLAVQDPEEFTMITEQHLRYSNFETIQYLLVRAYTANGEKFANEAIDYLCEQPLRLETGGDLCRSAVIGNEPYWATQLLLKSITPHSSEEKLSKLEDIILNYYTEFEKTAKGFICRGEAQLLLLEAIDSSRRSELATRRLQEWRRKFPDTKGIEILQENEPPDSLEASLVKSPIPKDAADKMSDKQWLQAIAHYDYGDLGTLFQRTGKLIGGAHQLSSNLENQVKKQPLRFASLIWKIPDNANSSYFDAILTGIAEVSTDVETALQVCQRCHQLPNRPCGRSIAWLFNKLSKLQWSEEAFEILIWYALNDPNPQEESWRTNNSGNIVSFGINSTRGAAVSAIAKLIFADKSRTVYFQRYLEQIIQDPSISVKCCAAEALTAVLNYDHDLAVSLFIKLCQTEDDILGTPTVERFLYYVLPKYFQVLMPILERMITSNLPEVIKVVTQQVCRASLVIEEAYPLAENCLSSTEQHRISATTVFVDNLKSAHFRQFCENKLTQLFNDVDEKVRAEAARCFFQFERDELGIYRQLVEDFVESSAFATNYRDLIHALDKTTAKLPDITCSICEKIVRISKSDNRSDASHIPYADKISKLLIRVYSQSKDKKLRSACSSASLSRCLDIVDCIAQTGVYGLNKALQEFER
ncbi:ATP-binding protein [Plectonema cf. radiosum LEGE 06105]|uniref:ATP-binding protein n=1 Tax=Plectonema cf. radiosum LEGE 06105 TaxID=945769 RepID=A0A8J7JVF0_9CYAN|nr:ATP-binding protein [Plectonema radiosum]MBE9214525.1 ATP-binding protein [Plectonema cf. radiosum LEGE 06105]